MKSWREHLWSWDALAILCLATLPLVFYWQATLGLKAFVAGDVLAQFFPFELELSHALIEGRLPLWTPGMQAGFPLFAESQVAALYPSNLVLYRFLPTYLAITYAIVLHLAWAGVGMYLFCRLTGLSVVAAVLGGLVLSLSGFMTAHIQHLTLLTVVAWLPWLLLFQAKYWQAFLRNGNSTIWFILMSVAIGLQFLAGHPQVAALSVSAYCLWGVLQPAFWTSQSSLIKKRVFEVARWLPRTLSVTFAPLVIGVGIAAVQLIPSTELLGLSFRDQPFNWSQFTADSLDPLALSQFLAPYWRLGEPAYATNMEQWGYIGIVPILFVFVAIWLNHSPRIWTWFILGVFTLSLALGALNPLYPLLYHIPVFNRFRVPTRFLLLFTFAAAYLAAVGFQELAKRLPISGHFVKLRLSALALLFVAIILSIMLVPPDAWSSVRYTATGLILVAGVGLLALTKLRITRTMFMGLALSLTLFDLALFAMTASSSLNWVGSPTDLVQIPRSASVMDKSSNLYRVFTQDSVIATSAGVRAALMPNTNLAYGKQAVTAYVSLPLRRNSEYIKSMSPQMLDLENVRYFLQSTDKLPGEDTGTEQKQLFDLFDRRWDFPSLRAEQVQVISYADHTQDLPDGSLVGEVTLFFSDAQSQVLPIRLGAETADWTILGMNAVDRNKPAEAIPFPAYLSSIGHTFDGLKYVAHYNPGSREIVGIAASSFVPSGDLTIERVLFVDDKGKSTSLASLLHQNDFSLAFRSHLVKVWENPNVFPRAFIVHQAENATDEQMLARLQDPNFNAKQVVLLSDGKPLDQANGLALASDEVAITSYEPERVSIQVKTDRAGYLILADSWYPDWQATIDGIAAPIYRADYIFRVVPILPGEHIITFEYHPTSFIIGSFISLASIAICIAVAIIFRRKRVVAS